MATKPITSIHLAAYLKARGFVIEHTDKDDGGRTIFFFGPGARTTSLDYEIERYYVEDAINVNARRFVHALDDVRSLIRQRNGAAGRTEVELREGDEQ